MSRLGINTGTNPNDGQGDSLRKAMGKINSNFAEIYNVIGDGNNLISYASTAGISTLAQNLTGSPIIHVDGIINSGITTTEHLEVRNITSAGIITAVQFVGDGSQLENVVATSSGVEVLDDNVRKGIAKELNFGQGIFCSGPDGVGRVTIAITTSVVSGGGTGGTPLEIRNQNAILGEFSKLNFGQNLYAYVDPAVGVVTVTTAPGGLNISGVVTATSFIGNGSGLTGIPTFSGNYNDLYNKPTIPSVVGLASEGYVDSAIDTAVAGVATFSGNYNDLYNKPTIPSVVGLASEGYVDIAVAGIPTFSGNYNDLYNKPTIPSVVGLASEGYVDNLVAISTFSGDYNDLSNVPSIPSVVGLASEGYVDTAVAGVATFSGDYNDLVNTPTIPINLTDLSDVNAGAPSTGHVLKWSGSEWQPAPDLTASGVGIGLSDLSVTISAPGINSLTYNNSTGIFQFTPTDLSSYVTSSGSVSYASSSGTSGGLTGTPNISVNEVGISSYLSVLGISSFYNNVHIKSERGLFIGDADEFSFVHTGANSYIENTSPGYLILRDGGEGIQLRRSGGGPSAGLMAAFNTDAGVELYYDSVIKFQTFQDGVSINDSVGIGTTAGNPPYRLTVSGIGATITQGLLNAIADLTSSVDGYGQVNIRNSRSAANASGDLVITADTGTDASDYINLGINNTGFTTSSWTINGPLDGYLYASDRNISIGAASAGRYLSLFAGDTLIENEKVRVTEGGVGIGSTQPTSMLAVSGDVSVSGVITATSFSGSGVNLTGVVTSLVGYATEGYVDAAVSGVSTFSGDYNDLINQPSIPSIVGLASEGYVDAAVSGVSTFSGDYNDLINQPSIPSIVGLASEGYVDAAVSVVGSGGTWAVNASGIHTSKNVGIGTELSSSALWVEGNGYFSGVVTATRFESTSAGTPTIDSPNNLNINAINVAISTDLTVGGDAYVGVDTSSGLILTSPNGTQYRLVVDNSGNLSTVLVP